VLFVSAHGLQLEPPSESQKKQFEQLTAAVLDVPKHEKLKASAAEDETTQNKKKVKVDIIIIIRINMLTPVS
jgi:hypothetical protein